MTFIPAFFHGSAPVFADYAADFICPGNISAIDAVFDFTAVAAADDAACLLACVDIHSSTASRYRG